MPRLKSVTENGLITIEWNMGMIVPIDLSKIEQTEYVVLEDEQTGQRLEPRPYVEGPRRKLRQEWFDDPDMQYLIYLRIIRALEIRVYSEYDDGRQEEIAFSWDLVAFTESEMQI